MPSASRTEALFLKRVRAPLPRGLETEGELVLALDGKLAYLYCAAAGPGRERLEPVQELAGRSAGAPAGYRYVVETDAAEGWEPELERWYAEEHLALLAAVPGCVRARRFRNLDGAPRSHACYDLVSPEVLKSAEWLAVRETPWSGRVRPQFRNTLRTMFRIGQGR